MNPDFDAIKKSADIVRVIEDHGVVLKKQGADYVGLCPFHDDKKPSLRVTPAKGLFHCMSCGAAGNVIQFVAKKENIAVKEAALRLMGNVPGVQLGLEITRPAPLVPDSHPELFAAILDHYHRTLLGRNRRGLDYLKNRGLTDPGMLLPVQITNVSFDGTKYWQLESDDAATQYSAPQWTDTNGNYNASDPGEHNYAVAYTRNTKPQIGATFKIPGAANWTNLKFKATGPDGISIPATAGTVGGDGVTVTMPVTESTTALPNTVKFYNWADSTSFTLK